MTRKYWIVAALEDQEHLTALGVTVGTYNLAAGEFRDCEVSDEAFVKLDPLWGEFVWGPMPAPVPLEPAEPTYESERLLKHGPVITLTTDEVLKRRLTKKLAEYEARLVDDEHRFRAPECNQPGLYKRIVLKTLLETGRVECWPLSREWAAKFPSCFDSGTFSNACHVVHDYNATGGKRCVYGSLPPAEAA